MMMTISTKTLVCLERGSLILVNNLYFQNVSVSKNDKEYLFAYFGEVYCWNVV